MQGYRRASPTLKDRIERAYHDYGRLCSAHPIACLCISIITMIVLSYPAVTRFRLPVSSPIDVYWTNELKFDAKDDKPKWISSPPAVFLQQIIVRGGVEPWISLNLTAEQAVRGPLSRAFDVFDILRTDEGVQANCFHISGQKPNGYLPTKGCLLLSPTAFWGNLNNFLEDPNVLSTVFLPRCTPAACLRDMLLGIPTGMTGIKRNYQTNRKRSIDFSLTLFLAEYDPLVREKMKTRLSGSGLFSIETSKEADENIFVHVFYRPRRYFSNYFPLVISYLVFMVYLYYSARKLEMVASRWGLAFAAAFNVATTLLMTTGICAHLDLMPTLWSAEIFPYIALILGLENTLCITRSVVNTPPSLDVSSRIAHGLSLEGYALFKYFALEMIFLAVGYSLGISEIQEFCSFAAIGLIVDFYMQLLFYAPCLTFDLQRLNKRDKLRFGLMMLSTEIPHLKVYPPVNCPMRSVWPRLFERKFEKKRRLSDSQLDEKEFLKPARTGGMRRANSVSKWNHQSDEFPDEGTPLSQRAASARLRFFYFVTRTRIMQRSIMAVFVIFTVWQAFVVHSNRATGGGSGFGISHHVLETAPQEWGEWQRRTFKWWPVLFGEYNVSLSSHYITFLPPIVLKTKILPTDPVLQSVLRPEGNYSSRHEDVRQTVTEAPNDIQSRIYWLETQLKVYLAALWLLLLASVVGFILFACFRGRWRAILNWIQPSENLDLTGENQQSARSIVSLDAVSKSFYGHRFPIECVSIVEDQRIISVCHEGKVYLWNASTGDRILKLNRLRMPVTPDGPPPAVPPQIWCIDAKNNDAVLGCCDGSVEVACLERNKLIGVYHQSKVGIAMLKMVSSQIIVARLDGSIDFIDCILTEERPCRVKTIRLKQSVRAHVKPITQLKITSLQVISASFDRAIRVFDLRTGETQATLLAHNAPVIEVCVDHGNLILYSACEEGRVCFWSLKTFELLRTINVHSTDGVHLLFCSNLLVSYGVNGGLRLWDKLNGKQVEDLSPLDRASNSENGCAVALNNEILATSNGQTVVFWDVRRKTVLQQVHTDSVVDALYPIGNSAVLCQCGSLMYRINKPSVSTNNPSS